MIAYHSKCRMSLFIVLLLGLVYISHYLLQPSIITLAIIVPENRILS